MIPVSRTSPYVRRIVSFNNAPLLWATTKTQRESLPSSTGELSGNYFGILNIFATIPQFIGTLIAAAIFTVAVFTVAVFAVLEPGKSPELVSEPQQEPAGGGSNAIAVCLFLDAMSTAVAAFATLRLKSL